MIDMMIFLIPPFKFHIVTVVLPIILNLSPNIFRKVNNFVPNISKSRSLLRLNFVQMESTAIKAGPSSFDFLGGFNPLFSFVLREINTDKIVVFIQDRDGTSRRDNVRFFFSIVEQPALSYSIVNVVTLIWLNNFNQIESNKRIRFNNFKHVANCGINSFHFSRLNISNSFQPISQGIRTKSIPIHRHHLIMMIMKMNLGLQINSLTLNNPKQHQQPNKHNKLHFFLPLSFVTDL
mmetsp:Transcript_2624/g.4043  ORF Transcript_2624/g.4043 Transcript_2624/m.4043 type:complete len:235 (-) Transcript_2624:15-719(-)